MPSGLTGVRRIRFAQHPGNGVLTVYPANDPAGIPFAVARVFTIAGVAAGGVRGRHAHRRCAQLIACLSGQVTVLVTDGRESREITLASATDGLVVPPGVWTTLTFAGESTVAAVFCDQPYDEGDYIRDWDEFLRSHA
jgi:dTDP-4-dehydrorhamnose 3,5-epimerase-like enzyme